MPTVTDPVCGMLIEAQTAAATSTYEEVVYYFCSIDCKQEFDKNPKKYADPRFTKTGPIVAPKFGSATSGGGEFEPLPDDVSAP